MFKKLHSEFFARETLTVARELLGCKLIYNDCEGIIVETEAYRDDAASHAVTRPNKGVMLRETYGCVYIYFTYGMHYCLNFTTEKNGVGAVLIRAVAPLSGIAEMKRRRGIDELNRLTNGPAKLFQAFGISPEFHGQKVGNSIQVRRNSVQQSFEIAISPRIGISKAKDLEWRFFIKDNEFVSKKSV